MSYPVSTYFSRPTDSITPLPHHLPLVIPLKSELAVEMLEKGRVRFWLQAEKISGDAKIEYVFNDVAISQGEVRRQENEVKPVFRR